MDPTTPARWPSASYIANLYRHRGPGINELARLTLPPSWLAELMRALHLAGRLDGFRLR